MTAKACERCTHWERMKANTELGWCTRAESANSPFHVYGTDPLVTKKTFYCAEFAPKEAAKLYKPTQQEVNDVNRNLARWERCHCGHIAQMHDKNGICEDRNCITCNGYEGKIVYFHQKTPTATGS